MKFTFIGAGSYKFTRKLVHDILTEPIFTDITISLMDIDQKKLDIMKQIIGRMISDSGKNAKLLATTDTRESLRDADIVVTTLWAGRLEDLRADHAIPASFGMRQTVADTVGPGGVFYGIRNAAVLQNVCQHMEEVAPRGLLLNYTNPMAINSAVLQQTSSIRSIGLCHEVQYSIRLFGKLFELPYEELEYIVAGVNHTAWFLKLCHNGVDLYPRLHELAQQPEVFELEPTRFELMQHFGLFMGEGSRHHTEYNPYFLHFDDEPERLGIRYNWGVEEFTPEVYGRKTLEGLQKFLAETHMPTTYNSVESFLPISRAYFTGNPVCIYGNVMNNGLISNLPANCAVEVPVFIDRNGFNPVAVGAIPGGAGARTAALAFQQALAAEGIIKHDLRYIREAILCDPNTSASLRIWDIERMVDALITQNKPYLEGWTDSRHSIYRMGAQPMHSSKIYG